MSGEDPEAARDRLEGGESGHTALARDAIEENRDPQAASSGLDWSDAIEIAWP